MIVLIAILVWLTQGVPAYYLFKKSWLYTFNTWTVGDRNVMLFLSAMPVGLITAIMAYISEVNKDKPAKW